MNAVVSSVAARRYVITLAVLGLALALRLLHLSSELQSPLSYQPGPDEDYYLRFGQAVAANHGASSPEFTFMDPAYGYLLGGIFKLVGANPILVYLLQALLDTATAYAILLTGRELDRPRAGLIGAILYGTTATAVMFCSALLKETCVAAYLAWWVLAALILCRSERRLAWLSFGALCGIGMALRSTLGVLVLVALVLPCIGGKPVAWGAKAALVACGMAMAMLPWSLRDHLASGNASPLPHNGGIVLHQAYNADNPASTIWIPAFVNYSHPSEIWRGYAAEAAKRLGRPLDPNAVDRYWGEQALQYMREHPEDVAADVLRKAALYLSATEIPNNRSAREERLFSPVMAFLPPPAAWLLAMGLTGLIWYATQERRWLILVVPIALAWGTFAVFWAEDRFRFHSMPMLALCSGIWLDAMLNFARIRRSTWALMMALPMLVGLSSLYLSAKNPAAPIGWERVVWGYIKMGRPDAARQIAARTLLEQPNNAPLWEALGFLSARSQRYAEAVSEYRRALAIRPRSYLAHYNLAKAYLAAGDADHAAAEAREANALSASPDAEALLDQIAAAGAR